MMVGILWQFHKIVHKSYQCEEFRVNCFARLLLTQTLERTKNTKPKNISAFNSQLNIKGMQTLRSAAKENTFRTQ